ncbi:TetR/AcrR family transcriptional regulator [Actinoplanes sp. KI2]|uniref:TetR/AcrR family transcriptional regulator n=1 Tax=Actinoplanes sp. KI2 TaxID=2983315 RepID=UPI0021D5EF20|nr:TetR/AcrR family transcriptional regulator [Actinoplanes sp. KI2]MCU7729928.1 TetR/AcrR family transcriptional regulator [Actinoplanes sp. KI2]
MARLSETGDSRRTDTRARILTVALRLFAERGYATTSLREIAEELGVTKAALYFHYRTKEDIVSGILRGYTDGVQSLLDAYEGTTPTLAARERLLRDFAALQAQWGGDLTKLIRQNYTEVVNLPAGGEIKQSHHRLIDALAGPAPTVLDRTRAVAALATLQSAAMPVENVDEQTRREAALVVSLEVLRACGSPHPPASAGRGGST